MSVTLDTSQELMSWLKEVAENMARMLFTLETFQDPISWSKNFASADMLGMADILETSREHMFWLKGGNANVEFIFVALETCQDPMSWLKEEPANMSMMSLSLPGHPVQLPRM
jgi:hypothetical protein